MKRNIGILLFIALIVLISSSVSASVFDFEYGTAVLGSYPGGVNVSPSIFFNSSIRTVPPLATNLISYAVGYSEYPSGCLGGTDQVGTGAYYPPPPIARVSQETAPWPARTNSSNNYVFTAIKLNDTGCYQIMSSWIYGTTTFANLTFSVSRAGDFATKLSGVTIYLSNGQSNTTNANGEALFYVTPPSISYTYSMEKSGYSPVMGAALGGFGQAGGTLYTTMTPTAGGYSITVLPASIPLGSNTTGTIIGTNLGKIRDIVWSWGDLTGSYLFTEFGNASRPMDYINQSAIWYGYDKTTGSYSRNKGAAILNPVVLSNISTTGDKTITCLIGTDDGLWYTLTAPLTITQGSQQTLILEATDAYTNNLVSNTNFTILNVGTNAWTNVSAPTGTYNFVVPYNTHLDITAKATAYSDTTLNWTVGITNTYIMGIPMYPTQSIAVGNVTLNVLVNDAENNLAPIPGALVFAYIWPQPVQLGISQQTSGAGVSTFNLSASANYIVSVTKYGYASGGASVNTGTGGLSKSITITLHRATAPTPTVTIPTAVPSGLPTTSAVGPAGNYTGFWGPMYSMWSAMGADAFTMQLLMACFFIFCGVVVGGFGMGTIIPGAPFSGTGAEAGGVFAFVLAAAFGFISILWIVVIFVWLAFRYFLISR